MSNNQSGRDRVVVLFISPAANSREEVAKYIEKLNQTAQRILNSREILFTPIARQIDNQILNGIVFKPSAFISETDYFEKIIDKTPLPEEISNCSIEIKHYYQN